MKILYVTTISLTMNSFFKPHIQMLVNEGNQVDIACNYNELAIDDLYRKLGCNVYQIDFSRSPLAFNNIKAYKQLNKVIAKGKYDIVHCHTPNAAVITRLVCRKYRKQNGLKVFYTAHGFHFFKGAPRGNWILYYPVEKICSYFTDKLITINQEDYKLAKCRFKAKEVYYVPGVGLNLEKFTNVYIDRDVKRQELNVPKNAFMLLSVGELNDNKNHQIIIKALAKVNNPYIHYVVAGTGEKKDYLLQLAKRLNVDRQVHLLGYRKDIPELNCSADVFCFPSYREGLGIAALEAMACGLPLITSNVHGINDYSINGITGYTCNPRCVDDFSYAISCFLENRESVKTMSHHNRMLAEKYNMKSVIAVLKDIYMNNN